MAMEIIIPHELEIELCKYLLFEDFMNYSKVLNITKTDYITLIYEIFPNYKPRITNYNVESIYKTLLFCTSAWSYIHKYSHKLKYNLSYQRIEDLIRDNLMDFDQDYVHKDWSVDFSNLLTKQEMYELYKYIIHETDYISDHHDIIMYFDDLEIFIKGEFSDDYYNTISMIRLAIRNNSEKILEYLL